MCALQRVSLSYSPFAGVLYASEFLAIKSAADVVESSMLEARGLRGQTLQGLVNFARADANAEGEIAVFRNRYQDFPHMLQMMSGLKLEGIDEDDRASLMSGARALDRIVMQDPNNMTGLDAMMAVGAALAQGRVDLPMLAIKYPRIYFKEAGRSAEMIIPLYVWDLIVRHCTIPSPERETHQKLWGDPPKLDSQEPSNWLRFSAGETLSAYNISVGPQRTQLSIIASIEHPEIERFDRERIEGILLGLTYYLNMFPELALDFPGKVA